MNEAREKAIVLVKRLSLETGPQGFKWGWVKELKTAKEVFNSDVKVQRAVVDFTLETLVAMWTKWNAKSGWKKLWFGSLIEKRVLPAAAITVSRRLLDRGMELCEPELVSILKNISELEKRFFPSTLLVPAVKSACCFVAANGMSPELRVIVKQLREAICLNDTQNRKLKARLQALLEGGKRLPLRNGEAWSDAALLEIEAANKSVRERWVSLIGQCDAVAGGSPSQNWLKAAKVSVAAIGFSEFKRRVLHWFPLVDQPRTQPVRQWHREYQPDPNQLIIEPHANILKGLVWCCGLREDKEIARALTALALSAYRKIPLKGPREVKVGNACVTALGMMPGMEGVGQLALLKVRVKFGTAQKMIEKALEATAQRVGLPREELEEMAVPAYGLTEVGRCTEKFGDFTAELAVSGSDTASIGWIKSDGKRQQSVPAVVKEKLAADLKELRVAAKDIQRMLSAQRERIDNLFREQKMWPLAVWRERYLDHPLVGVLARRLIWEFTSGKRTTAGIFFNGAMADLDLKPLTKLGDGTTVRLWHPIGNDGDEIVAWRAWLDAQQIQQPFKQAHREVYLLTDAERQTRTYSNRFAAHIIRQHQFNALCAARGWKNKLRLMVDAEYPPATVLLPRWNLRAEFWIEGVGEEYGADTNDSGVFLRLATDQVRFYRSDAAQRTAHTGGGGYYPADPQAAAEPLPLEEIPPLVFSEVMRDVDLFVGVASVGNDPTWSDGGPEGQYRDYWQSYSFGELNATARTRREVLERLVPRLKIAGQCSFEEKFLVVKGSLRTYKVHLGSGNILMKPNDQYLCIVPKQSATEDGKVLLPFDGDRTLSVILSKAFLLADDAKIKDSSIVSQIKGR